jgi:small-conductance mechanosensitive channel
MNRKAEKNTNNKYIKFFFSNWANPPELLPGSWDLHDLIKGILEKKKARFLIKQILKDEIEKQNINKKTLQNKKKKQLKKSELNLT